MKKSDYILIIAILFALIGLAILIFYYNNQGMQCIADPLKYAEKAKDTVCTCSIDIQDYFR